MYLINLHAVPTNSSEHFEKIMGAFVSTYIDYKDIDGAVKLAQLYVEDEGWKVGNVEDEYYIINSANELEDEQKEVFDEAKEHGYAMFFNCYESDEEE